MKKLKEPLQRLLKRIGLYYRIKASGLYDLYWTIVDKPIIDDRRAEVSFYTETLIGFRPGDLVFDIGANEGYKTDIFLRMGARVVAVEPDEHGRDALRKSFLSWRLFKKPVVVVSKAVSDQETLATMWIDAPGCAKNTLSRKWVDILRHDDQRFGVMMHFDGSREVETITLERLIELHGRPLFIKIDVEGYEAKVLNGLHRSVPYLSFEVNLPEFRREGEQCIERLASLDPDGKFNYAVDCRHGLVLDTWRTKYEFATAFEQCAERSIEVFWRGNVVLTDFDITSALTQMPCRTRAPNGSDCHKGTAV
jgi:FkbM family methyltransferase